MQPLSHRVTASPRSGIRAIFDLTLPMDDVISFAVGEPSFSAAPHVIAAGQAALSDSPMHYTDVGGVPALREAIATYTRIHKGVVYDPSSETQVTHGATAALNMSFLSLVEEGAEVILGAPYFATYENMVVTSGGTPVPVPLDPAKGFRHDAATIASAVTPNTRVIVINSPSNPTGAVTPRDELERIAAIAIEHDLWVISDEVYHRYVYGDTPFTSIAAIDGMHDRTVLIDSFSKTFAMTGWRLGYLHAPATFVRETSALAEAITSSNNSATQVAGIAALEGDLSYLDDMLASYRNNRDIVARAIEATPLLSLPSAEGAFYAFVDVTAVGLSSHDFAMGVLREEHVAVVPGDAFGAAGEGYVRISYVGAQEDIREGMRRVVAFAQRQRARD